DRICVGKRRGSVTILVEARGGRLHQLSAGGGRYELEIVLATGMWGATRLVPARRGVGEDILYVRSHGAWGLPTAKDGDIHTLTRFAFERGSWVRHERSVPGEWVDEGWKDDPFPDLASFP